jgi:hypothetical protein
VIGLTRTHGDRCGAGAEIDDRSRASIAAIVIKAIAVNKRAPTSFCVRTASDCRNVIAHDIEAGGLEAIAHALSALADR